MVYHISAFDLDHTLFTVNFSYKFGTYLYQKNLFSFKKMFKLIFWYGLYKSSLISLKTLHDRHFAILFKSFSKALMLDLAQQFLEESFADFLCPSVFNIFQKAIDNCHYTILLSSSPDFLVELVAKKLQFHAWQATEYCTDEEGNFSHVTKVLTGQEKSFCLQALQKQFNLTKNQITAYSDSYVDLAFLQAAGSPIAVRPDRRLLKHSKQCNWQVFY